MGSENQAKSVETNKKLNVRTLMDHFVRGVGSNRGQGDQDGVEVPRMIEDIYRENIPGYIYSSEASF